MIFSRTKKAFEVKQNFFLVSQVLSFRLKKQTSKNVADTTFKSLEESGLLIKDVCEPIKNDAKYKGGFLGTCLGTLAASILGNVLARKPKIPGWGVIIKAK